MSFKKDICSSIGPLDVQDEILETESGVRILGIGKGGP